MDYDEDDGFNEFLSCLVNNDHLDGAAEGITKQVISEGEGSLSSKQKWIFQNHVLNEYVTDECTRGGCDIPWSEMYEAYDNGGMCSWCAHMDGKDD